MGLVLVLVLEWEPGWELIWQLVLLSAWEPGWELMWQLVLPSSWLLALP
ncbi:MAG: hypothetical protein NZ821_07955 [Gloeomargarita sp. SKYB31]|nr:hypothetical protein [Gloeomargarita sp. SKYB31]